MNNDNKDNRMPPADTGNASNPSPRKENETGGGPEQLIDPRGEKYLREVASPEDYPDAQDEQDMEAVKEDNK